MPPRDKEQVRLVEFGDFYGTVKLLLGYIIVNPYLQFVHPLEGRRRWFGIITFWMMFISIILGISAQIWFLVHELSTAGNFLHIAGSIVWILMSILGLSTMVLMYSKSSAIVSLLHTLHELFPKTATEQQEFKVREFLDFFNSVNKYLQNSWLIGIFVIFATPPTSAMANYLTKGEFIFKLPMFNRYPFEPHNNGPFVTFLVYVFESWVLWVTTGVLVGTASLLGSTTIHVCLQFKMLAQVIKAIRPTRESFGRDKMVLRVLLRKHNVLLDISTELRNMFSVSMLANYLINSMIICLFAFLAANSADPEESLELCTDFIGFSIYNAIYSFYGDQLIKHVGVVG